MSSKRKKRAHFQRVSHYPVRFTLSVSQGAADTIRSMAIKRKTNPQAIIREIIDDSLKSQEAA